MRDERGGWWWLEVKRGVLFLTLIPVDGFFIYFSTYLYYTVVLTPKVF